MTANCEMVLTKENLQFYPENGTAQAFLLNITFEKDSTTCVVPEEIFLYRNSVVSETNERRSEFIAVCSVADIKSYPTETCTATSSPCFFRKNSVSLLFRSLIDLNTAWENIKKDVDALEVAYSIYTSNSTDSTNVTYLFDPLP